MEEKEKNTIYECENQKKKMPEIKILAIADDGDEAEDVIVIPVAEYRHLVRCEAAVELMTKLLKEHGKYDSTRAEIIEAACALCREELEDDTDVE